MLQDYKLHLIKNHFAMEKTEHTWNLHLKSNSAIGSI